MAAEKIVTELKLARNTRGRELAEVSAPLLSELIKQNERCLAAGTTLEQAVDHWLPLFHARLKSLPLSDAVDEYLDEAKGRLKPPTLRDKKQRLTAWVTAQPDDDSTVVDACDVEMGNSEATVRSHYSQRRKVDCRSQPVLGPDAGSGDGKTFIEERERGCLISRMVRLTGW